MKAAELFVRCLESENVDMSSMTEEALMERIRRGEDETLQLNSSLEPPASVAKYLAAFANTNGGTIVFGVARPARVLGVDERSAWRILDRAQALLSPQVDVDVDTVEVEGHKLVAAHVERSTSPVAAQGAFFWRTGDRLRALTAAEIRSRVTAGRTFESALVELSYIAATQTRTIESLAEKFDKANSWARRLGLAGVGAIAGAAAKQLFDVLVA
jgi:predicted HTH transcriptional regulator